MARFLSIDDSRAVHAYMRDCFADSNVDLIHAYSGQEGLDLVAKPGQEFDLIFLDWEMPGLSGPEVLTKIRSSGVQTPVIMVTSKNETSDIAEVLAKGAQEYVMKPFTDDILYAKVEDVIGFKVEKNGAH